MKIKLNHLLYKYNRIYDNYNVFTKILIFGRVRFAALEKI
ncbi:hypothetical protein LEP1GSC170_2256 [Leptospira interrogans serovar Bataviae str. HAI135]|nr:hypothetical protein LEP1GSC170_2256 [Leptospira interrogans serovar Bataviae str. HAI135]